MLEPAEREALRRSIKEAEATADARSVLADCRTLVDRSDSPADMAFCCNTLRGAVEGARSLRTFVVRSVTMEPMLLNLKVEAALAGYALELRVGGFGSYAEEMMDPDGALGRFAPELVVVVFDLEDVAGRLPELCGDGVGAEVEGEIAGCLARVSRLLEGLRRFSGARVVVQGLVAPDESSLGDVGDANLANSLPDAVGRINRGLAELCRGMTDCVFFDVDRLAARQGRARWRDGGLWTSSRLPVAPARFREYARGLFRAMAVQFRAPRKVLCTDLDNTLWGGVLGEEGVEGIVTGCSYPGSAYLGYQRYLKQLGSRGVLLAVASKNDEADVREAFRVRAGDLALQMKDFAAVKIGWGDKVASLRAMARELSLGLDAFVLVDDSPVECEAVRQQMPEVAVVEAPVDEPWKLVEMLAGEPFFDAVRVTVDDRNRSREYRAQAQRAELAQAAGGRDEFLQSLGIVCRFGSALEAPLARAVQLLGKTNQFNLTTRRRTAVEVEEFARTGMAIAVRVRDRFGEAGVVGMALASFEGETCRIDSFLLSCRVIGRGIETALLSEVAERARRAGATRVEGEFVPTGRNGVCAGFYPDHGFGEAEERGEKGVLYALDLRAGAVAAPWWIGVEGDGAGVAREAVLV